MQKKKKEFLYRGSKANFPKSEYLIWIRLNISKNSRLPKTRTLEGNRKKVLVTREFEADGWTQANKKMDVEEIQVYAHFTSRQQEIRHD